MEFAVAKSRFARQTRRGVPFLFAGVIVWTLFGILGGLLPEAAKPLVYLLGSGAQFPLGLLLSRAMGIDPFAKQNPLGPLVGMVGGLQILFVPITIFLWKVQPAALPWCLAVLVGAHFLPFAWIYDSKAYLVAALGITAVGAGVGLFLPSLAFVASGFGVATVLLLVLLLLRREG